MLQQENAGLLQNLSHAAEIEVQLQEKLSKAETSDRKTEMEAVQATEKTPKDISADSINRNTVNLDLHLFKIYI